MLIVLAIMSLGILLGILLQNSTRMQSIISRLTLYTIYLLLGIMGFSIGTKQTLLDKFPTLGLQAVIITLGSVAGSVLMGWIAYRFLFKTKHKKP